QDPGGADHLYTALVLRPAQRVREGGGPLPAGVLDDRGGEVGEVLRGDPAGVLDHLRGVARVVAPEDLEDAARVLQGLVPFRKAARDVVRVAGVGPAAVVVGAGV